MDGSKETRKRCTENRFRKEPLYYEVYDPVALKKIINTQREVTDFEKKKQTKRSV